MYRLLIVAILSFLANITTGIDMCAHCPNHQHCVDNNCGINQYCTRGACTRFHVHDNAHINQFDDVLAEYYYDAEIEAAREEKIQRLLKNERRYARKKLNLHKH
eukprot:483275_1